MIEPGTLLGTNRIVKLLASGGMGQVYVAEDTKLERRIALKVLPADLAEDPERLERFEREAKVVASLNHPNIVTIHSVEEAQGPGGETLHFITMELVEGNTLDREIEHGGLTIDRFFSIAVPLADAVGAAHQQGITHRDLKPGNVMFTVDGRLKVLDFGLAKLATHPLVSPATDPAAATAATVAAGPITEEGKVLGTIAYMSPEQAEGKPVDNRSDIFSLGIMLHEMVTGSLPFTGDTKMSLMSSIIKDTPVPVTEIKRELPNHLGRIVKRCLEKDPNRRFQSAQDVRLDLAGLKEEIDSGEVVTTQSSIDAMQASGIVPGGAPATDPGTPAPAPSSMSSAPGVASPGPATAHSGRAASPAAPPSDLAHAPVDPAVAAAAARSDPAVASVVPPSDPGTPSDAPAAGTPVATRNLLQNKLALASIGAALVVAVVGWWMLGRDAGDGAVSPTSGEAVSGGVIETVADTRPSVAVLYFDNLSGDESLDWLRSGLTELLVTDLSQSPELRVLTTDKLYEILDKTGNLEARTTSAAVVRAVAEQGDVDHVVVGSFIRAGEAFRLSARLQEPSSGETLAAETVEGVGEDSVFGLVDDLTRRIKDRLEVPISASPVVDRDLSDVTTSSMDAYRYYTDGVNLISQNRYTEAIPVFERAVEIDPEFAMAFAKLSIVHGNIFDNDTARTYAEKSIEHADRLTQRERYYIEGRYYSLDDETVQQSIDAYENALALYPDDSASRNNVALEYSELEQYDETIAHFEELLRRGSPFLPAYFNTAVAYVNNDECDKGFDLIRDFARRQPDYHFGYRDLAGVAMLCGRFDEAWAALGTYEESIEAGQPADVFEGNPQFQLHVLADEFDEALQANEKLANSRSPAARYVAYRANRMVVGTYRGDVSESLDAALETADALPDDAAQKGTLLRMVARAHLQLGDTESALAYSERARDLSQDVDDRLDVAAMTAIAQSRAGRSVAARAASQEFQRLAERLPNPWVRRLELMIAAELAAARGDVDEAVEQLRSAVELLPPGPDFAFSDDLAEYSYALAAARLEAGDRVEAASLFGAVTEAGMQRALNPFEYVRSFYYLGKIAQEDGNDTAARRYYARFLDYWGNGEIDRDKVEEARSFIGRN